MTVLNPYGYANTGPTWTTPGNVSSANLIMGTLLECIIWYTDGAPDSFVINVASSNDTPWAANAFNTATFTTVDQNTSIEVSANTAPGSCTFVGFDISTGGVNSAAILGLTLTEIGMTYTNFGVDISEFVVYLQNPDADDPPNQGAFSSVQYTDNTGNTAIYFTDNVQSFITSDNVGQWSWSFNTAAIPWSEHAPPNPYHAVNANVIFTIAGTLVTYSTDDANVNYSTSGNSATWDWPWYTDLYGSSPVYVGYQTQVNLNGIVLGNTTTLSGQTSNTYTSNTAMVLNPNPITIISTGKVPQQIWIPAGQFTDFVVEDEYGNLLDYQPNVLGVGDPSYTSTVANSALLIANTAYQEANLATFISLQALREANGALAIANGGANTAQVYCNSSLVANQCNINFSNTLTVNVAGSNANVSMASLSFSFNANTISLLTAAGNSAVNGWCSIASNSILQWGVVQMTKSAPSASPLTVTFPVPYVSACWSLEMIMDCPLGDSNEFIPRPFNVSQNQFLLHTDNFNIDDSFINPTNVFWIAIGT